MPIHMHAHVGCLTVLLVLGACSDKGRNGPSSGDTGPTRGGVDTGVPEDVPEDVDGDGFSEDDGDCDDDDPDVSPDGVEVCDGIDQDCDGIVDLGASCYDDDGDGYSEDDGDCDDHDAAIHPGAEDCGVVDANCDGVVDDVGTWVPRDYEVIQDAIDAAADGASICVESGTYVETLDTSGKPLWIVGVYGAASTVLDGSGDSPVLSIVAGEGRDTVVEGFTITGGTASTSEDHTSGGVLVIGASPTLRGLVVTGNQASDRYTAYYGSSAGGMVLVDSNARVDEVEISDNSSATTYGVAGELGRPGRVAVAEVAEVDVALVADGPGRSPEGPAVVAAEQLGSGAGLAGLFEDLEDLGRHPDDALRPGLRRRGRQAQDGRYL